MLHRYEKKILTLESYQFYKEERKEASRKERSKEENRPGGRELGREERKERGIQM